MEVQIAAPKLEDKEQQPLIGLFPSGGPPLEKQRLQLQLFKSTEKVRCPGLLKFGTPNPCDF